MMKQSTHPTHPTDQEHHAASQRPLAVWVAQIKGQSLTIWKRVAPVSLPNRSTRRASILQTLLQVVLWAAFGAFLFASLPHVAYFFAAFEPESSTGTLNDYWWVVSYGLAASIDVTPFLLSLNVAIKMRHVTVGLPWYHKIFAAFGVLITHWPFILLLVGFSWLVNFEHASEFHSSMLAAAEQVSINLLIWQGKLADLNPVIASSFPLLTVAYTGMADQMGEEQERAIQNNPAHPHPAAAHPSEEGTPLAHEQALDMEIMLQALQANQEQILQAVQTMMEHHQQATQYLTQLSLARFTEALTPLLHEAGEQGKAAQGVSTAHAAESRRPGTADVPDRGKHRDGLRSRDPAVVLRELIAQHPHLADNEADALQVIALYQQGLDRSKIRETLRFGTRDLSAS
jgi:hypothetical protein